MTTLWLPRARTPRQQQRAEVAAYEHPGRRVGTTAGGWLADLAALRKMVVLCDGCDRGWSPTAHGYRRWRRDTYVVARCDACRQTTYRCKAFMHEADWAAYHDTRRTPRRGRWTR